LFLNAPGLISTVPGQNRKNQDGSGLRFGLGSLDNRLGEPTSHGRRPIGRYNESRCSLHVSPLKRKDESLMANKREKNKAKPKRRK